MAPATRRPIDSVSGKENCFAEAKPEFQDYVSPSRTRAEPVENMRDRRRLNGENRRSKVGNGPNKNHLSGHNLCLAQ